MIPTHYSRNPKKLHCLQYSPYSLGDHLATHTHRAGLASGNAHKAAAAKIPPITYIKTFMPSAGLL